MAESAVEGPPPALPLMTPPMVSNSFAQHFLSAVGAAYCFNPYSATHARLFWMISKALHDAEVGCGQWGAYIVFESAKQLLYPTFTVAKARNALVSFQMLVSMSQLTADAEAIPDAEAMRSNIDWWVDMHERFGSGLWLPPLRAVSMPQSV